MAELNYEFKKRLAGVHKKNRRVEKPLGEGEIAVTSAWTVAVPADDAFLQRVGRDLQDYFFTSMGVEVGYTTKCPARRAIVYVIDGRLKKDGAYRIEVTPSRIKLIGKDARAAAQASYLLEDLMNLAEAPYVKLGRVDRAPIFRCRMVHSGVAEDEFPDAHLNAIAHSGINTVLLFVRDINRASTRFVDFNDVIRRAEKFGIDVYAYSYMKSRLHPDDEGAEEFYDGLYGNLFRKCPGFKGVVFVGEDMAFPSKDPRTSGLPAGQKLYPDGTKPTKPHPGWFPCSDYPQWVNLVKKIIRREQPDADIIFWTYNWGKCDEAARIDLIEHLPKDISLQATFEMFENLERDGVPCRTTDYSLFFPGPGKYFLSEAKAAGRCGIPLYGMTNAAGLTWDVGTVPYEPVPYQWLKRYAAMRECHDKYGLVGSMECHHYGFYPSFISELAKAYFTEQNPNGEEILERLIVRDWGAENLDTVKQAYHLFSEAVNDLTTTDEDQYGPMRIGPSYPLVLFNDHNMVIPYAPYAHFGNNYICRPNYAYPIHLPAKRVQFEGEIRLYKHSAERFIAGAELLKKLLPALPANKREDAQRIAGIGEFMGRAALTTHNVKRWYLRKTALLEKNADFPRLLEELRAIAAEEIENAKAAIPLVDFDSRLGYELSIEYMCDRAHLEWKIGVMERILREDIPELARNGKVLNPTRMDYPRGTWEYMKD